MATNLLWYVLAGFLLGFAASTLWEWFYFRKERLKLTDRRIRELEAKIREVEEGSESNTITSTLNNAAVPTVAAVTAAPRTSAWSEPAYRSPGVFLESEEFEAEDDENVAKSREVARPSVAASTSATSTASPFAPPSTQTPMPAAPTNNFVANTPVASVPASEAAVTPRSDQPSPADALRAKRVVTGRTRQELLASLRRNSEAVQRGEQLPLSAGNSPQPEAMVGPGENIASLGDTTEDEPLQEEIAEPPVPAARQRWMGKPELTQRSKEYPDDLSKIKGIGDVYKQRLYRAGLYTWQQIADSDEETLRRATSAYPSSNVEEWHPQAEKLMEKFGRKGAVYHGPLPDDMTKILGIGPVGAAVLYKAGICTYEQLATVPKEELAALFPIAVAGDQPDFGQWLERAMALADEKYGDK